MALIQVCDVCRTPGKQLTIYTIGVDGEDPVSVALCEDDDLIAELVSNAETIVQPAPLRKSTPTRRAPATKRTARKSMEDRVLTVDEIKALKHTTP